MHAQADPSQSFNLTTLLNDEALGQIGKLASLARDKGVNIEVAPLGHGGWTLRVGCAFPTERPRPTLDEQLAAQAKVSRHNLAQARNWLDYAVAIGTALQKALPAADSPADPQGHAAT